MIKPLIVFLQAKEIPQVLEEQKKWHGFDLLRVKYVSYPKQLSRREDVYPFLGPHEIAINYFLNNPKYTHIVFCPPDLIVKQENIETLIQDIKKNDYEVISGVCNVDDERYKTYYTITSNLPSLDLQERQYNWISKYNISNDIIDVLHIGLSLQAFRRDIIKKIISKYPIYHPFEYGLGADIMFSNACADLGVPMYANTGNIMKHLRFEGKMLVGKKRPQIVLQRL